MIKENLEKLSALVNDLDEIQQKLNKDIGIETLNYYELTSDSEFSFRETGEYYEIKNSMIDKIDGLIAYENTVCDTKAELIGIIDSEVTEAVYHDQTVKGNGYQIGDVVIMNSNELSVCVISDIDQTEIIFDENTDDDNILYICQSLRWPEVNIHTTNRGILCKVKEFPSDWQPAYSV